MRLREIATVSSSGGSRFEAIVEQLSPAQETVELYFQFDVADLPAPADAYAAAMLLPSMRANEPLIIEPSISQRLHLQLPRIMRLFHTWFPEFRLIAIETTPCEYPAAPGPSAATFFSGGVDSFYTMLKHLSGEVQVRLSHLLFMRGVETPLDETDPGISVSEQLVRETAAAKGLKVVTGETNVRAVLCPSDGQIQWEGHYHGSALAAVALALKPLFHAVCIPSTFTYNDFVRHGSSPILDEMYSTEAMAILHDGAEATRAAKVERIVAWDRRLVLDNLRVCMENAGSAFNCGRCKKCVRTAIALAALGVLDEAKLFAEHYPEKWPAICSWDHEISVQQNISFVLERGADPYLLSVLRRSEKLRRAAKRRQAIRKLAGPAAQPLERVIASVRRNRVSRQKRKNVRSN
jgi:hypothetical protein